MVILLERPHYEIILGHDNYFTTIFLLVSGLISGTGEAINQIVDSAKNGFRWQASVGVEVIEQTRIKAGEKIAVNNQAVIAPPAVRYCQYSLLPQGRYM